MTLYSILVELLCCIMMITVYVICDGLAVVLLLITSHHISINNGLKTIFIMGAMEP